MAPPPQSPSDDSKQQCLVTAPFPLWVAPLALALAGMLIGQLIMAAILVAYGHRALDASFGVLIGGAALYFACCGAGLYTTAIVALPSDTLLSPTTKPRYTPSRGRYQYLVGTNRFDMWMLGGGVVAQGCLATMSTHLFTAAEWQTDRPAWVTVVHIVSLVLCLWHLYSIRWERLYDLAPLATTPW